MPSKSAVGSNPSSGRSLAELAIIPAAKGARTTAPTRSERGRDHLDVVAGDAPQGECGALRSAPVIPERLASNESPRDGLRKRSAARAGHWSRRVYGREAVLGVYRFNDIRVDVASFRV